MPQGDLDAVFVDRDGTINVKAPEGEYIGDPGDIALLPGAAEAIGRLNAAGIPVAVVTNQRGIALGRMTEDDLRRVHERLDELLAAQGAHVDDYEHCPHDLDVCDCRKPGTALLEDAADRLGIEDLTRTAMIGDAPSDVEVGRRVGATTVLLRGPGAGEGADAEEPGDDEPPVHDADAVLPSLLDAVLWLEDHAA
jgi:D-glycero-D-manno-heptose 1,7-bisphosphate phosphatase